MMTDTVDDAESMGHGGDGSLPERYERRRAEETVADIRESAERIRRREVEEALGKLDTRGDVDDVRRETLEEMADAIVKRVLLAPVDCIVKTADGSTVDATLRLFDPESESGDERKHPPGSDRPEVTDAD